MAYSDNFNRADENLEANANWTRSGGVAGALAVRSNQCATISATVTGYLAPDLGSANHFVQATSNVVATGGALQACRLTDGDNCLGVTPTSGTQYGIYNRVGGSNTITNVTVSAVAAGDVLKLVATGSHWNLYVNGVWKGTGTINAALTSTRTGLVARTTVSNPWWDDYSDGLAPDGVLAVTIAAVTQSARAAVVPIPFTDSFTRADENLEASPNWTHDGNITGGMAIVSNELRCTTTDSSGTAYKAPDQGSTDHYVQFAVRNTTSNTGPFACCRLGDRSNFIGVRPGFVTSNGQLEVYRRVGGTLTSLYTGGAATVALADVIKLQVLGSNFTVYKNGSVLTGPTAIGDGGSLSANTRSGFVARATVNTSFDDFETGTVAGGAISATLAVTIAAVTSASHSYSTKPFRDAFDRSNENLEVNTDYSHDGAITGAATVSSNKLNCATTDATGSAYKAPNQASADHYVQFKAPNIDIDTGGFIAARLTDRNNFLGVRAGAFNAHVNWGKIEVARRISGTLTTLYLSSDSAYSNGDTLRLEAIGTDYLLYRNGVLINSGAIGDASLTSVTDTGLVARATTGNLADDFETGPLGNYLRASIGTTTQSATGTLTGPVNATFAVTIAAITQSAAGSAPGVTLAPVTGSQVTVSQGTVSVTAIGGVFGVTGEQATVSAGTVTVSAPSAFHDNFNRANANLESSLVASSGASWAWDGALAGAATISSNALKCNTTTGGSAYTYDLGNTDQTVSWTVRSTTPNSFVMLRADNINKYIGVRVSGTNFQIYRNSSGFTGIYNTDHGIVSGDTLSVTVTEAQTIRMSKNGALLLDTTYGSTAFTGTRVGVHMRQAIQDPLLDDFSAERYLGDVDIFVNVTGETATVSQGSVSVPAPGAVLVPATGSEITVTKGTASVSLGTTGVFSDTFDRANANLEDTAISSSGGTWTHDGSIAGGFRIFGNALDCQTTDPIGSAYKAPNVGTTDHFVEFKLPSVSVLTGPFACCRMTDNGTYVGVRAGANTTINWGYIQVYRRSGGGTSLVQLYQAGDLSAHNNDIFKLGVIGNNFYLLQNGNLRTSGSIGDASLTSTGTGLLARSTTGILFNDFRTGVFNPIFVTGEQCAVSAGDVTVAITYTVLVEVTGVEMTVSDGTAHASTNESQEVFVFMDDALTVSQGDAYAGVKVTVSVTTGVGDFMLASAGSVQAGGFTICNVTGIGMTLSTSNVQVNHATKPNVSTATDALAIGQGSVAVRANTGVTVTNPALLTLSMTGVTIGTSARVEVTCPAALTMTDAAVLTFKQNYKVIVTGEQMTMGQGGVFISGIPIVASDLGEGVMLAMDNWMGNR